MRRGVQFGLVGALLALAASVSAQGAPEWQLRDFHSIVNVADDGSAVILERLELSYLQVASGGTFMASSA